jgi:hypothetical protein
VLEPNDAQTWSNLGGALQMVNEPDEAIKACQRALELQPTLSEAHTNLAAALLYTDRADEAFSAFDRAIALADDNDNAKRNKAIALLHHGHLREGWELFEPRWQDGTGRIAKYSAIPRWDGNTNEGTTLVWADQGLGDQILYASMIEELAGRAGRVVLEVEPRLAGLFTRSFPTVTVHAWQTSGPTVASDAQFPLSKIGQYFRSDWTDFPQREEGYLVPGAALAASLRARLSQDRKVVIGVSWISKNVMFGRFKTATLADFQDLFRLDGCRFVDLQYGNTLEERRAAKDVLDTTLEHLDDIDNTNDIDSLAALIATCDLVVTVSNTTAHLAGALGKETWVAIPHGKGQLWYWFKGKSVSPWYPSVQLRRQQQGQSWKDLISSVVVPEVAARVAAIQSRNGRTGE